MLNNGDIKFIKMSLKYAMMRMEELPLETWGDYQIRYKRIQEEKEKQSKVIKKLDALI